MTVRISHGGPEFPYPAFTRWRNVIAELAGYDVRTVTYPDGYTSPTVMIDWGHLPETCYAGDWGGVKPEDPLLYLIAHSDCDGHLKPKACARLATRLEELLPQVAMQMDIRGIRGVWVKQTQAFIQALQKAAASNEWLRFY